MTIELTTDFPIIVDRAGLEALPVDARIRDSDGDEYTKIEYGNFLHDGEYGVVSTRWLTDDLRADGTPAFSPFTVLNPEVLGESVDEPAQDNYDETLQRMERLVERLAGLVSDLTAPRVVNNYYTSVADSGEAMAQPEWDDAAVERLRKALSDDEESTDTEVAETGLKAGSFAALMGGETFGVPEWNGRRVELLEDESHGGGAAGGPSVRLIDGPRPDEGGFNSFYWNHGLEAITAPVFKKGQRVRVVNEDSALPVGAVGTVIEDSFADEWVFVDWHCTWPDGNPIVEGGWGQFRFESVD